MFAEQIAVAKKRLLITLSSCEVSVPRNLIEHPQHIFPPSTLGFFSEVVKFVTYWTAVSVQREETISRVAMSGQALCPT